MKLKDIVELTFYVTLAFVLGFIGVVAIIGMLTLGIVISLVPFVIAIMMLFSVVSLFVPSIPGPDWSVLWSWM